MSVTNSVLASTYIDAKEWFLLEQFYQRIKHPNHVDKMLLLQFLGKQWSEDRLQNWFQHYRQNEYSKFQRTQVADDQKTLWNQFQQLFCFEDSSQLAFEVAQCKARMSSYLAGSITMWKENGFTIEDVELKYLVKLNEAYSSNLPCQHNDEHDSWSELFDIDLSHIPTVQTKLQNHNTAKNSSKGVY